ncbi:MAG: hypothetical protein IH600_16455 [Bacteroidetes bacterium]|nr:hypothetical protein [Bacteroidota bacterium]
MARKSFVDPLTGDQYVDRPTPDPRPISPDGTFPFPTKVPIPPEVPWVQNLPPLVIDISVMDRTAVWLHDQVRYAKWAIFLIRLTLKTIQIIQSACGQSVFPPEQEQSNG